MKSGKQVVDAWVDPLQDEDFAEEAAEAVARLNKARRRRHRTGLIGLVFVVLIIFFAVFGPALIGKDPNAQELSARLLPLWSQHESGLYILGTDSLGRDVAARLASGARASLTVVLASLGIGGSLGIGLGMVAGLYGGWRDNAIMRLVDAQLAVPGLIFAMLIAAILGVGFWSTAIALGFASWPIYARLLRVEVLRVKEQEFIEAAQMIGVSTWRLLRVHLLPNVVSVLVVVGTLELGRMILVESSLSFIGLGMQPPDASWGSMIRQGQDFLFTAWWLPTLPGVFIMITVLGMNLMGDWLRDVLDPRTR